MDTSNKLSSERRRGVMIAGLAGISGILTGTGGTSWAQRIERIGKIDQKLTQPVASMIPGIAKVRLREETYQPGASNKAKMRNAMICECTQGTLEIAQDNDKPFVAETGRMWTCNVGTIEITANKGNTPAIMRVIDLMKA